MLLSYIAPTPDLRQQGITEPSNIDIAPTINTEANTDLSNVSPVSRIPPTGAKSICGVRVEFSNTSMTIGTKAHFEEKLAKLNTYMTVTSNSNVTIPNITVTDEVFQLGYNDTVYVSNEGQIILEGMTAAIAAGYTGFDSYVVFFAGGGAESGAGILWSSAFIEDSSCCAEFEAAPYDIFGVLAHEYGHTLGLYDLYDVDSSSYGIGDWGVMELVPG